VSRLVQSHWLYSWRSLRISANVCCRGPEIELCIGDEGTSPATDNDWSLLPFMALSDGAHLYVTGYHPRDPHGPQALSDIFLTPIAAPPRGLVSIALTCLEPCFPLVQPRSSPISHCAGRKRRRRLLPRFSALLAPASSTRVF
jgi:hypothetical protein